MFPDKLEWVAVLVSMFLHGGWIHLGSNMLFLWVFGNNVEDRLGRLLYVGFYVAGGIVATIAYVAVNSSSTVPLVGASGAIAAVMGAYLVWYPTVRIRTAIFVLIIFFTEIQARWLLGFWFVLQFFTEPGQWRRLGGPRRRLRLRRRGRPPDRTRPPLPCECAVTLGARAPEVTAGSDRAARRRGRRGRRRRDRARARHRAASAVTPDSTSAKRQPRATAKAPSVSGRSPIIDAVGSAPRSDDLRHRRVGLAGDDGRRA